MKIISGLLVAVSIASIASVAVAQEKQPSLQDSLAQSVRALGSCQVELGSLRGLQANVIDGTYVDWATATAQIEAANPTLVVDLHTHKVTPKPDPQKVEGR